MKKLFALTILLYSAAALSQVNYYKGEWTKVNSEANFSGLLRIEIKDSIVTGDIIWTFRAIDSNDVMLMKYYKEQKGKMGIEHIKGIYQQKTFDIHVEGIAKTDPDLIIGMDKYLLKLSADRSVIYGRSLSNGENNGLVYFSKMNNILAEKEFNALKAKLAGKKTTI